LFALQSTGFWVQVYESENARSGWIGKEPLSNPIVNSNLN